MWLSPSSGSAKREARRLPKNAGRPAAVRLPAQATAVANCKGEKGPNLLALVLRKDLCGEVGAGVDGLGAARLQIADRLHDVEFTVGRRSKGRGRALGQGLGLAAVH